MQLLIWVMVGTGAVGGFAGYLISLDRGSDDVEPRGCSSKWINRSSFTHVVLGVIAAAIVPLFLNLAQSNLLNNLVNVGTLSAAPEASPSDIFVFGGLCLIAAISSRAFILSISARVSREARQARKTTETAQGKVEQAIDSITDP